MKGMRRHGVWIFAAAVLLVSAAVNLLSHTFDNKYSWNRQEAVCGVMELQADDTAVFLTKDWEFYQGELLTPKDFDDSAASGMEAGSLRLIPDAYLTIGGNGGLELIDSAGAVSGGSHGSATYRLRILTGREFGTYTLELPEIFSAYRLWVDGRQVLQRGNPDPANYEPEIAAGRISFEGGSEIEIILAVSDFSHYYSGMVYPPVFGSEEAVNRILSARLIVKSATCLLAAVVAVAYLSLFLYNRGNKKQLYFSMVCLGYLGFASYGLIHTVWTTKSFLWYRIEDGAYLFLLFFLCILVKELCGTPWMCCGKWETYSSRAVIAAGLLAMAASLVVPNLLSGLRGDGSLIWFQVYSGLMDGYKIMAAVYMMGLSARSARQMDVRPAGLLGCLIFFAVSSFLDVADRWYEPVIFGWGAEFSGFVLIVWLAFRIVMDSVWLRKQNEQLHRQEEKQQKYMQEVVHDLKSPLAALTAYAELTRSEVARDEGQRREFLLEIESRAKELGRRIQKIQRMDCGELRQLVLTEIGSLEYLGRIADQYRALAGQSSLELRVCGEDFIMKIDTEKMSLALENLIMNSIRFTEWGGRITLEAHRRAEKIEIVVSDTGAGMDAEYLNRIFRRGMTEDRTAHSGLGLYIVSQIAEAHHGSVRVMSEPRKGSRFILELGGK